MYINNINNINNNCLRFTIIILYVIFEPNNKNKLDKHKYLLRKFVYYIFC